MNSVLRRRMSGEGFLTVDVEWAQADVLADLVGLFDERGLKATFFCTHDGVDVAGHERALHPNFRRGGDTMKQLGPSASQLSDALVYRHVVDTTRSFCPEAIGVRGHSQFFDSTLLPIYEAAGLKYDSSLYMPFSGNLAPTLKPYNILELPIYYIDYSDLVDPRSDFDLQHLGLEQPGLKVFDFHPNIVFTNASSCEDYERTRSSYHDYDRLLKERRRGRGVRTLLIDLLDYLAANGQGKKTLAELNTAWRNGCGGR